MPTPWPKPAPRMVNLEAAAAVPAGSRQARAMAMKRVRARIRTGSTATLARHDRRGEVSGMERKASDLFVECLEVEGVEYVFGIPGEETLDLNESLANSSVDFIPVRHEQGAPYMADMYERLTQRAGVCLGTLGPGATNLVTGVADAFLDHSALVALTGQADPQRVHKESHQQIDIVSMFKPVTKWNTRLNAAAVIPEVVRKAFKVAQEPKPGPTHIELPEDVMGDQVDAEPLPSHTRERRLEPSAGELLQAAELIRDA